MSTPTTAATHLSKVFAVHRATALARHQQASDAVAAAAGQGHNAERVAELAMAQHEAALALQHWADVERMGPDQALRRAIRGLADDGSRSTDPITNEVKARERIAARRFVALLAAAIVADPGADKAAAGLAALEALAYL